MITKYGYDVFFISIAICLILILTGILVNNNLVRFPLLAVGILFLLFTINFFRDPERTPPKAENVLISPADGKIILIKEIQENKFINDRCYFVSIFMSPLDVHVNRIPIDGKVTYLKYYKGNYIVASEDKASEINERNEIGLETKFGKILFVQVAGFVARRIVCDLELNQETKKGERFGMIKFGSRVDVIVPKSAKIKCTIGQRTKAGETILFEF